MSTQPRSYRQLWLSLISVISLSFLVLGYYGSEIYHQAPPVPQSVVTPDGAVLFTGQDIKDGQNVWQSMGGQDVGTVWGHGAYVAPDWSADWLHRESVWLLNHWAAEADGKTYAQTALETQAALKERLNTNRAGRRSASISSSVACSSLWSALWPANGWVCNRSWG